MSGINTYYWTNDQGSAEIDFIIDTGHRVISVEVKAETNLRAKSLKVYAEKFKPEISVRTAMTNYEDQDWLIKLPLWAIETISK
ncbi:DUF4143 domain-containing protein [Acidaminobacter sp.]|uniref:DUF4143 domain-containing protein n=1 Tax=Acidaminobacter sp. TaxID=1872102 RepID=UPI0025BCF00A|nr:DUF4143 domain-containing protein [Acidaminobacter sp.]